MASWRRWGLILPLAGLLAGCSSDRGFQDLQQFMANARAKPGGKIEPIPTFPPHEVFKYGAMALRSPFDAPATATAERVSGTSVPAPDESRAREVLPPHEVFKYGAMALRSPFDAPATATAERVSGASVPAPDESRAREVLENYNFAALSMVGILNRGDTLWSLIDDGAGQIHRVTVGNYLGKNHGRIAKVSDDRVDVIEIIPDGEGGWVERPRTLSLQEKRQ